MYFMGREQSPLKSEHWKVIDEIVINTAKKVLVGRRFLHLFGPFRSTNTNYLCRCC